MTNIYFLYVFCPAVANYLAVLIDRDWLYVFKCLIKLAFLITYSFTSKTALFYSGLFINDSFLKN